jgi:hypothetical protein
LQKRRSEIVTVASGAGNGPPAAGAADRSGKAQRAEEEGAGPEAGRTRRGWNEAGAGQKEEKDVARLVSSDGFLLLRGKNARGNRRLLKMGRPYDLWLHVEDGPGAHLIIRLSHAAEEPPAGTLREAAILAGEKSWQRYTARARVMVARLRHVHAVKGAEPGTVRVDRIEQRLCVSLDRSGREEGEEDRDADSAQNAGVTEADATMRCLCRG